MTYNFYIGSNNKTGRLEIDYLEKLKNIFNSFTVVKTKGFWQGREEVPLCANNRRGEA